VNFGRETIVPAIRLNERLKPKIGSKIEEMYHSKVQIASKKKVALAGIKPVRHKGTQNGRGLCFRQTSGLPRFWTGVAVKLFR